MCELNVIICILFFVYVGVERIVFMDNFLEIGKIFLMKCLKIIFGY